MMDVREGTGTAAVEGRLRRLRARYRIQLFLHLASRVLPAVLIVAAIPIAVSRWWALPGAVMPAALGLVVLALAVVAIVAARRTPAPARLALHLDRRLATGELLAAACDAGPETRHPLAREARKRAGALLAGSAPKAALRLTGARSWRGAALATLAVAAFAGLPPASRVTAAAVEPDPDLPDVGRRLAPEIAAIATALEGLESPTADEAFERLERFTRELEEGRLASREEALLELERVEQALREAQRPASSGGPLRTPIDRLLDDLAEDPFAGDLAATLAAGDMQGLEEALEGMARAISGSRAEMETRIEQLQRLTERLGALAERLRAQGFDEEADLLEELNDALRNYDLDRASRLIRDKAMGGACRKLSGLAEEERRALAEMAEALRMARFLLDIDRLPGLAEAEGEEGGRPGPGPGSSSTNEEGEGYAAGDPLLRNRRSDATSDRVEAYEMLYDSHVIQAESWVDVQARGAIGEDGAFASRPGRARGVDGEVSDPIVPFGSTVPQADERAQDLERVPPGYRDLVQRYFARTPAPRPEDKTPGGAARPREEGP